MPDTAPAASVSLREVTNDTVLAVCRLKAEPEGFVAPNSVSIAQAYFRRDAWFRAIHAGEDLVGFVMLSDSSLLPEPPPEPAVWLWRLMIDRQHKGRGHGSAAMQRVIEHVRQRHPQLPRLLTAVVPGPGTPRPFYERLGFVATGEVDDGEEVLALALRP